MYGDLHRYFLQFILKHSYVPVDKALQFCSSCTGETQINSDRALNTLIAEINEKISAQQLRISLLKCEVTGNSSLALINTANDSISKQQNGFSPVEIEYFQHLLNEIITAEEHRLQTMACYNLNHLSNSFRKDHVEKFLEKCVQLGYLVEKDAYIYLGSRCIVEFSPHLSVHFKEYYSLCNLCAEPVFTGRTCLLCKKMMHGYCIEKWLAKTNKCPHCKKPWEEGCGKENQVMEMDESSDSED